MQYLSEGMDRHKLGRDIDFFLQMILVGSIFFKNKLWLGQDFFWGGGNNLKKNKYKTQAVITISFFPSMLKTTDII